MNNKVLHKIEEIRFRRDTVHKLISRMDSSDDVEWITVKGTHIPIKDGKAVGGPSAIKERINEGEEHSARTGNKKAATKHGEIKDLISEFKDVRPWEITAEDKEKVFNAIKSSGMYLKHDPNDLDAPSTAMSEHLAYLENKRINEILNGYSTIDMDSYVKYCHEKGTQPKLHEPLTEVDKSSLCSKSGKPQHDGTPVYRSLDKFTCLSDKEINAFAGFEDDWDPEGSKKIREATKDALGGWSEAERSAVHEYTKQYGPTNYAAINKYLVSGEGDESVKKAAQEITSALDHEIGGDCVTFRGQSDLTGIVNNQKLDKILKQIEKGNYSHASELTQGLEGLTVTNKAVMSTSKVESSSGYGQRPVQIIFKTPRTAKAVDITGASAYGGSKDVASKALLNTGLFGAGTRESEVAYRPGTSYKIEKVMFSRTVDDRGKKVNGKVFLVCSVL